MAASTDTLLGWALRDCEQSLQGYQKQRAAPPSELVQRYALLLIAEALQQIRDSMEET